VLSQWDEGATIHNISAPTF
jgi:hypothetical protein